MAFLIPVVAIGAKIYDDERERKKRRRVSDNSARV